MKNYGETLARLVALCVALPAADATAVQGKPPEDCADGMTVEKLDDYTNWVYEAASSAGASATVLVPTDARALGRWVKQNTAVGLLTDVANGLSPANGAGAALTDTAPTITVAQGRWRVLPAATLSANRIVTLGTAGALAGDQIEITRKDLGAFTLTITDGGPGTPVLFVMAVSKLGCVKCQFDGTNWQLRSFGVQ